MCATPVDGPAVEAVLEATGRRGVHSVIDAVAIDVTLDVALACVRLGGTVSEIGVHDLSPNPMPMLGALVRSITLRTTTAPIQQTRRDIVPPVQDGSVRTDGIFTHRFALDDAADADAAVAARSADGIKVLLQP